MSRVLSFRDIKRIPELSEYTETELLCLNMDDTVNKYLGKLGFDTNCAILYTAAKHRDLSGHVAVGYMAVGEINDDREYLRSSMCTTLERLIASAKKDMSLAKELSKMLGGSIDFRVIVDVAPEKGSYEDIDEEPDYREVEAKINALTAVRDSIRGTPYNSYGSLKTPAEYKEHSSL